MNPLINGPQDSALVLLAAQTLTASANGAAFDFAQGAVMQNFTFAPGGGGVPVQAIIPITSYDTTDGNETYTFKIQTSPDGTTWTDFSRIATPAIDGVPATGGILSLGWFQRVRYARLVLTLGGTTPSIVLGTCYVQPITNQFGG